MADRTAGEGRPDLLIALGNSLRGDDGVAAQLAAWAEPRWPDLRVRSLRQLTPEWSCELAAARRVLFVDAWRVPPRLAEPPTSGLFDTAPDLGEARLPDGETGLLPSADPGGPREVLMAGDASAESGAAEAPAQFPALQATERPVPVLLPLQPAAAGAAAIPEAGAFSHLLDPLQLLAITDLLYGRSPQAWQLLLPLFRCDHGEGLSPEVRQLLPQAEALLRAWCEQGGVAAGPSAPGSHHHA